MSLDNVTTSVYHYTVRQLFEHMTTGLIYGESYVGFKVVGIIEGGQRGLQPAGEVMSLCSIPVPEGCKQKAWWGFLEPEPPQWKQSTDFPDVWRRLLERVGFDRWKAPVILKVDLVPSDEAYVLDWAFMEESSYDGRKEAVERYWSSRVRLPEYDGSHRLPEVLVFNAIPEQRLSIYQECDIHEMRREIERLRDRGKNGKQRTT